MESGRVTLDGVDLCSLGLTDVRGRKHGMRIIPQDPVLFSGTLRDCLDPFKSETDEALLDALKSVNHSGCNERGLEVLDDPVDEGGANYSVGERQLLCLARAIVEEPRLLVMDEASASLDNESDQRIQTMLRCRFQNTTMLTIAHRLETIIDYDTILVMDDGYVAEFGPPQELLAKPDGLFTALVSKKIPVRGRKSRGRGPLSPSLLSIVASVCLLQLFSCQSVSQPSYFVGASFLPGPARAPDLSASRTPRSFIAKQLSPTPRRIPLFDSYDENFRNILVDEFNATATASNGKAKVGSTDWGQNFYEYAKAASGTLGDIMSGINDTIGGSPTPQVPKDPSSPSEKRDGLVTKAIPSGTLLSQFGIDHPLDRMALTANGNLQRLVSSYYDAPVEVLVEFCLQIDEEEADTDFAIFPPIVNGRNHKRQVKRWERLVHLSVHNRTFCTARSMITVHDQRCQQLVESGQIGIGQLFRYLDILPEFELHNAGPHAAERGGGFWREYTLKCTQLSCDIREEFQPGMWEIQPPR